MEVVGEQYDHYFRRLGHLRDKGWYTEELL
jgi:hypothetical protein